MLFFFLPHLDDSSFGERFYSQVKKIFFLEKGQLQKQIILFQSTTPVTKLQIT
jgi:hypothetical protein